MFDLRQILPKGYPITRALLVIFNDMSQNIGLKDFYTTSQRHDLGIEPETIQKKWVTGKTKTPHASAIEKITPSFKELYYDYHNSNRSGGQK